MLTSAADNNQSTAPSPSDKGPDSEEEPFLDDDEEYEEIEEEVEVEEEIEEEMETQEEIEEEEVEEEDDEIGEDSSPVNEDHQEDVVLDIESKGPEEHFIPGSAAQEKPLASSPTEIHAVEGSIDHHNISVQMDMTEEQTSLINDENIKHSKLAKDVITFKDHKFQELAADEKDSAALSGKDPPTDNADSHVDYKDPPNGNVMNLQNTGPFNISGPEMTIAISVRDKYSEEETKLIHWQSEEYIKQREPRLVVPMVRPRSLSPGAEFKDGNKRPAVICDFFARGWCIKGKSCRFLHIKDVATQQHEGAESSVNQKKNTPTRDEGFVGCIENPPVTGFPDAAASALDTSERLLSREIGENPRWKRGSQELQLDRDNTKSISSCKNIGRESKRENWYLDDHGKYVSPIVGSSSPICKDSVFRGTSSISSAISSDAFPSAKVSSYGKRSQRLIDDRSFSLFSHSVYSSSSTALPNASGTLPSNRISTLTRSSLSLGSVSWDLDPLGTQKHLDIDREYGVSRSASLQQSASPFSGESENPSWLNVSGDLQRSAGYKTKISFYKWEPSVPFRPSFSITQSLLSIGTQYDPIRDSIEPPKIGDAISKFSSSQGPSAKNTQMHTNVNPPPETFGSEYSFGKQFLDRDHNSVLDKKNYGKDLLSAEAETPGTASSEQSKRFSVLREEKFLRPVRVRDITKVNTSSIDHGSVNQTDGPRQVTESILDTSRRTSDMDLDLKINGDMLKESKAWKHFRVALIDFVKELVKPTWREGNLSKDAHKLIVKKVVDKVISAVPVDQIPSSPESVKLYLSSSQPKIAKLVEGYVEKYGKL